MRWKLLIVASLLAFVVGTGACFAAVRLLSNPSGALSAWAAVAALAAPLASVVFASVFVYRHTARRRTLQAAATALLASTLTLAALLVGALLARGRAPELAPSSPHNARRP